MAAKIQIRETYDPRQIHIVQEESASPRWTNLIKIFTKKHPLDSSIKKEERIFSKLRESATVFYFPMENVMNKGYYRHYGTPGGKKHLVYINTLRSKEKQAFSAAHEYGHTLGVVPFVNNYFAEEKDRVPPKLWERMISRFASELMMPEEDFRPFVAKESMDFSALGHPESTRAITRIMHEFFMPYRAVVYRLCELDLVNDTDARRLYGANDREEATGNLYFIDDIEDESRRFAKGQNYTELYQCPQDPDFRTARRDVEGIEGIDRAKGLDILLDELIHTLGDSEGWLSRFANVFNRDYAGLLKNMTDKGVSVNADNRDGESIS